MFYDLRDSTKLWGMGGEHVNDTSTIQTVSEPAYCETNGNPTSPSPRTPAYPLHLPRIYKS